MLADKWQKMPWWKSALVVVFWLAVWQAASMMVGKEVLLPSPLAVLVTLWDMLFATVFWRSALTSLWRIGFGFLLGLVLGVLLAAASAASRVVYTLLQPLMQMVRATPVASFIILALVWLSDKNLSTFISFLMVLPVVYSGTYSGIMSTDEKLLEMAKVFRVPFWRRVRAVYLPAAMPAAMTACELALGMAWKSGVAAEVIGLPQNTIGERLCQAKI
jgi:NitT/TauT family transport system permease protein